MPDPVEHKYFDHVANCYKTESLQLNPVKIWGLRNLNRAYHLDHVYVKFVNWIEWGTAAAKTIRNIDFSEPEKIRGFGEHLLQNHLKSAKLDSVPSDEFGLANSFKIESIKTGETFEIIQEQEKK